MARRMGTRAQMSAAKLMAGTTPRANAHSRADTASYKARLATATASSSGDPADHRKAASAHKVAAATNRNAGNSVEAAMHDRQAEAHQASVKAYQASGTKAVYDGSSAANRKAAALHQVALDKHAALGNHNAATGHEHAGQEHSNSFGTDPATGNTQSKARVLGVHDPIPKGAQRVGQNGPLVSINKDKSGKATGYTVHDKSPLDKANEKYHDASIKASVESNKANKSGKYLDHVAAANAHIDAAGKGRAVGLDVSTHTAAIDHHQMAGHNVGPFSKPGAARGVESPRARASTASARAREATNKAKANPTPENHKAAANAHRAAAEAHMAHDSDQRRPIKGHIEQAGYHDLHARLAPTNLGAKVTPQVPAMKGTSPMGAKGSVSRLPKGMIPHGTASASEHRYNNAARSASSASAHAEKANTPVAHSIASQEHAKAAHVAREQGNLGAAKLHDNMSTNHATMGKALYAKSAGTTPNKVGGGRLLGASLHGKPSAGAINISHPTEQGVRTKGAMMGMSTEAAGPHTAASSHAFTQSAKANAKPSLASHSLAAKAHLQAAGHYGTNDSRHEQHIQQAQVHKTHAQTHSQRIMKLKKLGPGQHHGVGGRFEGTPGGAK